MADILLIDDDPAVHEVLSAALKAAGHAVSSALTGPDGLAKIKARLPELLLLDFEMPGMMGEEVFAKLRGLGLTADIPIVFLSSLPLNRQVGRVDISRNVRFLRKPVAFADLARAIKELLPNS
ncbi:response regulator [bacterium]|nr:MAG: response regulator [bacterium]